LPELRLSALARFEARELVAVEWAVDNANGNPLALVELPRSLSPLQLNGQEPLVGALPPPTSLEQAFFERVGRLPPPAQTLMVIAAAEGSGDRAAIARAAAELGVDPSGLAVAEAADLVRVRAERLEFRHPLVRSAVYRRASFAERERAHLAVAAVLECEADADRGAWHRAAATTGPDADVAAELEGTADRARLRNGHAAAADALERAAELSFETESQAWRLVAAADAAWHGGQPRRAMALLDRASPIVTNAHVRAQLDAIHGQVEWRAGSLLEACAIFMSGAPRIAPLDSGKTLEMFSAPIRRLLSPATSRRSPRPADAQRPCGESRMKARRSFPTC
jgi:hypothetical protein